MTDWDGVGLPPAARARLEKRAGGRVMTSFLSVPGQLGLDHAGLSSVGEVMGCVVEHIGWQGYGGCGLYGYGMSPYMGGYGFPVTFDAFRPYADALRVGWNGAISRMLDECRALGGDGVVGVRLTESFVDLNDREFLALGTAVRHRGGAHLERPFSTTLSGTEMLTLAASGYMAASVVVALAVGIRHDDYQTRAGSSTFAPNIEIAGYSELVQQVRAEARRNLETEVRALGADGAILSAPMRLRIHGLEVGEGHRDHAGEASLIATSIVEYSSKAIPRPRAVLPLS